MKPLRLFVRMKEKSTFSIISLILTRNAQYWNKCKKNVIYLHWKSWELSSLPPSLILFLYLTDKYPLLSPFSLSLSLNFWFISSIHDFLYTYILFFQKTFRDILRTNSCAYVRKNEIRLRQISEPLFVQRQKKSV